MSRALPFSGPRAPALPNSSHTRSASVTLQAWASQPRWACGASPSRISGSWPTQPSAQQPVHGAQVGPGRGHGLGLEIPGPGQGFAEDRQQPDPGGAVVVGRLAPGVLVAFVAAPVGVRRIVQQAAAGPRMARGTGAGSGARLRRAPGTSRNRRRRPPPRGPGRPAPGRGSPGTAGWAQQAVGPGLRGGQPGAGQQVLEAVQALVPEQLQGCRRPVRQGAPGAARPAPAAPAGAAGGSRGPGSPPGSLPGGCPRGSWCPSR